MAVAEELGNINCGALPMAIGVQNDMATPALTRFGSEQLKQDYLVPTISGDYVVCLGVSEPSAGSDVASEFVVPTAGFSVIICHLNRAMNRQPIKMVWFKVMSNIDRKEFGLMFFLFHNLIDPKFNSKLLVYQYSIVIRYTFNTREGLSNRRCCVRVILVNRRNIIVQQ